MPVVQKCLQSGDHGLSGRLISTLLLCFAIFFTTAAFAAETVNVQTELLSAQSTAVPGSTLQLAIRQILPEGWHTYSKDPGDVGQPLSIQWETPANWPISDFDWPPFKTIETPPKLISHIYEHELILPFTAQIPGNTATGPITLQARIDYLICQQICIPQTATIQKNILIGAAAVTGPDAKIIAQAKEHSKINPIPNWLIWAGTALLAGLLLNLMPCILPMLLIKTTSFLHSPHGAKTSLVAYLAGLFASLYAMVLGLYFASQAIGQTVSIAALWQSKTFAELLFYILVLAAAWLFSGIQLQFHLTKQHVSAWLEPFVTGALAMVLALPCTGPLLGPLLFATLGHDLNQNLLIFTLLGIGYALPVILLVIFPQWQRFIPKSGLWLRYVKYTSGIIMIILAIWVVGLLPHIQTALYAALALILLASLGWRLRHKHKSLSVMVVLLAAILLTKPLWLSASTSAASINTQDLFTLQKTVQSEPNVFVYVTANWCLTCKLNEWNVIHTPEIQTLFKQYNIKVIVLDWTNRNPDIGSFLASHGRVGVPLYVWYHHGNPQILPQILDKGVFHKILSQAEMHN